MLSQLFSCTWLLGCDVDTELADATANATALFHCVCVKRRPENEEKSKVTMFSVPEATAKNSTFVSSNCIIPSVTWDLILRKVARYLLGDKTDDET